MRVQIVKEVIDPDVSEDSEWKLCFQWCRYVGDNGELGEGYRFIWRQNGELKPYRGQTKILSIQQAERLMNKAKAEGWGTFQGY